MQQMQNVLDGRYELEQKIGEGGMASVYRGRDLRLNRRVAVKVLHSRYANDPDFHSRFRHEAMAAAILTHPNVIGVYDAGQDGAVHYIVMEYVEGSDLKALIRQQAPLPIDQAAAIAEAIAWGLDSAHRVGLIHRDIKPQNIIVTPDGQVRISDFGIAKSHFSTALTETGVTFGTVDYISPEQAQGKSAVPASDIYSLGVTLYEMLTGQLPFSGDNAVAVAMQHVSATPTSPRVYNPQIPPHLEQLVLRTMAKDPEQRWASAQELAQQLQSFRTQSRQETVVNPALARRTPDPAAQRAPANQANGNTAGRAPVPPPRPAAGRAPTQQSSGCGVFLVGMLLLAGVLGLVFLFSTGVFNDIFDGFGGIGVVPPNGNASGSPTPPEASPTPVPLVAAPNLINRTDREAQLLLSQAQLTPVTTTANSSIVPAGHVIEQLIPPGTQVAQGQPFTYTLSLGPNEFPLPDFSQRRLIRAQEDAARLGLTIEVVEEPSRVVSEGFIIRQFPNPPARVGPGDTLRLYVSVGDKVRFPDVIGLSRSEAEALIAQADGLTLSYVDEQGPDRLPNFESYFPGQVVSASFDNGEGIVNGQFVPRSSRIVLGVRAN